MTPVINLSTNYQRTYRISRILTYLILLLLVLGLTKCCTPTMVQEKVVFPHSSPGKKIPYLE